MRRTAPSSLIRRPLIAAAAVILGVAGLAGDVWAQPIQTPGRAAGPGDSMAQVILWCGVLLLTAVVLAVVFFVIRKRLNSMDEETPSAVNLLGFTLADLRQMHAGGQLSDEEFDFAKRKMMARTKAQFDGPPDDDTEPEFIDLGDGTTPPSSDAANDSEGSAEPTDDPDPPRG